MKFITLELINGDLVSLYLSNMQNLSITDNADTKVGGCRLRDATNNIGWHIKCNRIELLNKLREYN